jgi:hypothetical protein
MSEIAKLLRFRAPAVKEIKSHQLNVLAQISGEQFQSQLSGDYARKRLRIYNNTDASSGEVYIGPEGVTPATGMILKKDEWLELNIGDSLDFYLVADSDNSELRILELA